MAFSNDDGVEHSNADDDDDDGVEDSNADYNDDSNAEDDDDGGVEDSNADDDDGHADDMLRRRKSRIFKMQTGCETTLVSG